MLCNKRRVLLAWEQGLGKTVISIAAFEKLVELGKAKHALIIGRAGDYWQWEEKINEFTDSKVLMVQTKKERTRTYRPTNDTRYTVTNWNLFRNDYDSIVGFPFDCVIADEAQEFSNFKSVTAKKIKRLNNAIYPNYRWALTGTAISNKLEQLYSIFYWIQPTFLPPWPYFEENHIVRDELGRIEGYKDLKSLNEYLKKRMDRKTHEDFKGQMPKLVEQIIKVPPDRDYKRIQTDLVEHLDHLVENLTFDSEGNVQLKRNAKASRLFHKARQALASDGKLDKAIQISEEILSENPSNRVVIFSYYKYPLYNLQQYFSSRSINFTGDESSKQKQANISRFRRGDSKVLLASNAGSSGLDLPFANYIIHLDVPFSHGILDQRNKRITRISSIHDTAVVIYLLIEDSIEEYYYQVVKNLGLFASGVLEGKVDEVTIRPQSLRKHIKGEDG